MLLQLEKKDIKAALSVFDKIQGLAEGQLKRLNDIGIEASVVMLNGYRDGVHGLFVSARQLLSCISSVTKPWSEEMCDADQTLTIGPPGEEAECGLVVKQKFIERYSKISCTRPSSARATTCMATS